LKTPASDWLPRNLFRRIEVVFPIEDGVLRERVINEILALTLADNTRARMLSSDGSYELVEKQGKARRSQFEFIALASGQESGAGKHSAKSKFPTVKVAERPF
jgi:polyphosphate kinase